MQNFWNKEKIILLLIILLGTFLRLYNLNWDQNQHLHPDERFLTMVTQAIKWPSNIFEYFSTDISPLNPHNVNFPFFVYGTFPIFLTKFFSEIFRYTDYNNLTLFGRFLSSVFDSLTILLIFLIGKTVFSPKAGLIASFLYSISVLPIQLSHFYTTDVFLNFFLILSLYLLINFLYLNKNYWIIMSGLILGLGMASKITAIVFGFTFTIFFLFLLPKLKLKILTLILLFCFSVLLTFRIFQPYAFSGPNFFDIQVNPKFIQNLQELKNLSQPGVYFPPSVQWNNTTPILYPLKNIIFWGMGIGLGILSLIALTSTIFELLLKSLTILKNFKRVDKKNISLIFLVCSTLAIFIYQGVQFSKPMRYFLPIYPLLALITANFLEKTVSNWSKKINKSLLHISFSLLVVILCIWPTAFISIYSKPHTRVTASEWIYKNIPYGATLAVEHWDDALPLTLDEKNSYSLYKLEELPMFNEDSEEKWKILEEKFKKIDYIMITSNRVYGSVSRLPNRYPTTIKYYKDLFAGNSDFKKIAEFTSRPSLLGFEFIDDNADEVFTVYDHPKITIFKKID